MDRAVRASPNLQRAARGEGLTPWRPPPAPRAPSLWARGTCRCQSYEGGLGSVPGAEAHGAFNFCGIAALHLLNRMDAIDIGGALVRTRGRAPACQVVSHGWAQFWQGVRPIPAHDRGARLGSVGLRIGRCGWRAGSKAAAISSWTAATAFGLPLCFRYWPRPVRAARRPPARGRQRQPR